MFWPKMDGRQIFGKKNWTGEKKRDEQLIFLARPYIRRPLYKNYGQYILVHPEKNGICENVFHIRKGLVNLFVHILQYLLLCLRLSNRFLKKYFLRKNQKMQFYCVNHFWIRTDILYVGYYGNI